MEHEWQHKPYMVPLSVAFAPVGANFGANNDITTENPYSKSGVGIFLSA